MEDTHSSPPLNGDPTSRSADFTSPRRKLSIPYILDPSPSKNTIPLQQAGHTLTSSTANQATPDVNANGSNAGNSSVSRNSSNSSNANDIPKEAPASTCTATPSGVSQDRDRVQEYHALHTKTAIQRIGALELKLNDGSAKPLKRWDLEEMVRLYKTIAACGIRSREAELKYLE